MHGVFPYVCIFHLPFVRSRLFAALVLYLSSVSALAHADEATVERLKAEAPIGWKQIREYYDGNQFVVSVDGGPNVPSFSRTISQADNSVRVELAIDLPDGTSQFVVELFNEEYVAKAQKPQKSSPYSLVEFSSRVVNDGGLGEGHAFDYSQPSVSLCGIYLPERVFGLSEFADSRNTGYLIKDAWSDRDQNGLEIVVVDLAIAKRNAGGDFEVIREPNAEFRVATISCRLELIPSRNWCAKRLQEEFVLFLPDVKAKNTMVRRYEAHFESDGFHPTWKSEFLGPKDRSTSGGTKCTFTSPRKTQFDKGFFTLTSIGLPEPLRKKSGSGFLIYCLLGIGMFVVLLGLLLRSKNGATNVSGKNRT